MRFSCRSLLLFMAVLAVAAAVIRWNPLVGIPLMCLAIAGCSCRLPSATVSSIDFDWTAATRDLHRGLLVDRQLRVHDPVLLGSRHHSLLFFHRERLRKGRAPFRLGTVRAIHVFRGKDIRRGG